MCKIDVNTKYLLDTYDYRFECDSFVKVQEHLKIGHLNLTDLSCRACFWRSPELGKLVAHVRKHHTKFNVHKTCLKCKQVFASKDDLEKHRKEKHLLYKCALCEFAADMDSKLVLHVTSKHCDQSFNEVITDYKCPLCSDVGKIYDALDPLQLSGKTEHFFQFLLQIYR